MNPIEVLLVEDNVGDVRLVREALHEFKLDVRLHVAKDGIEAMQRLRQQDEHADAPLPDVILLDLNLPRKDGREVLAEVRADARLQRIPVIVMTTSRDEEDVLRTQALGVDGYVTKPVDFDQFRRVVQQVDELWFSVVTRPGSPSSA